MMHKIERLIKNDGNIGIHIIMAIPTAIDVRNMFFENSLLANDASIAKPKTIAIGIR